LLVQHMMTILSNIAMQLLTAGIYVAYV